MSDVRLIDANELRKCAIPCVIHNGALTDMCVPLYQIDNAPTVEQEVYMNGKDYNLYLEGYKQGKKDFERPQGEWIDSGLEYKCSKCGVRYDIDITEITDFKFCPYCGAEMKGGAE